MPLARHVLALLTPAVFGACSSESDAGSPVIPETASAIQTSASVAPEVALDSVAQALAMALSDSEGRGALAKAVAASPFPEGKVDFNRLLGGNGLIRTGVESRLPGRLLELVAALPSIEMYLPVESHRDAWKGGPELVVAWQLDEWTDPIGYDLNGERVALSVDSPPNYPVLVLVPAEVDFSRPLEAHRTARSHGTPTGDGDVPAATSVPGWCDDSLQTDSPDIRLICVEILDLKESWPRGAPEIELHVAGVADPNDPSDNEAQSLRCVQSPQTGNQWTGTLTAIAEQWYTSRNLADSIPRDGLVMTFWEDDSETCKIRTTTDWWGTLGRVGLSSLAFGINLTVAQQPLRVLAAFLGVYFGYDAALSLEANLLGSDDDIIGHIEFAGGQSFPWSIVDEDGDYNGQVLCDCPFWGVMNGPYPIVQPGTIHWMSEVHYAPGSVSHEWEESSDEVNWSTVSTSSSYSRPVATSDSEFYLRLTVTSSGESFSHSILVSPPLDVSTSGPTTIKPDATCTWNVSVGSAGPFTYQWTRNGHIVGTGTSFTGGNGSGSTSSSFDLEVRVSESSGGRVGVASVTVTEDSNAPLCMQ